MDQREETARRIQGFMLAGLGFVALLALVSDAAQTSTKVIIGGFFLINLAVFVARSPR